MPNHIFQFEKLKTSRLSERLKKLSYHFSGSESFENVIRIPPLRKIRKFKFNFFESESFSITNKKFEKSTIQQNEGSDGAFKIRNFPLRRQKFPISRHEIFSNNILTFFFHGSGKYSILFRFPSLQVYLLRITEVNQSQFEEKFFIISLPRQYLKISRFLFKL